MSTAPPEIRHFVTMRASVSAVWLAVPVGRPVDADEWARTAAASPPESPPATVEPPDGEKQAGALADLLRLLRHQATTVPVVHAWVLGGRYDRLPRAIVPVLAMHGVTDLDQAVRVALRLPPDNVEPPTVDVDIDRTDRRYARIRQVVAARPDAAQGEAPESDDPAIRAAVVTRTPARTPTTRVTERFSACYPRPELGLTVVATCLADDPVHAAAIEGPVWHLLDALEFLPDPATVEP